MHIAHEKTFKLPDGSRLRVRVALIGFYSSKPDWSYDVQQCAKGKRKFEDVVDQNAWSFRNMTMDERKAYRARKYVEVAGAPRIKEVLGEAHDMLRPRLFF